MSSWHLTSAAFLVAAFQSWAMAAPYRGTITEVITSTNDPLYHVGQTFHGYYEYDAPTADGQFFASAYFITLPPGYTSWLYGKIYMPFATSAGGGFTGGPGLVLNPLESTDESILNVVGGHVAAFTWTWEYSGFYMNADAAHFVTTSFYDQGADPVPVTFGTMALGEPQAVVPDHTSTGILVSIALLVFACLSRVRCFSALV